MTRDLTRRVLNVQNLGQPHKAFAGQANLDFVTSP